MDKSKSDHCEREVGRTHALVAEIVELRSGGVRDSAVGSSDDDLAYALDEAADAVKAYRRALDEEQHDA